MSEQKLIGLAQLILSLDFDARMAHHRDDPRREAVYRRHAEALHEMVRPGGDA